MGFGLHTVLHLAGDVAAPVLKGAGAVNNAIGGGGELTQIGNAIADPNKVYTGALNPGTAINNTGGTSSFVGASHPTATGNQNTNSGTGGSGGTTSTYGGGSGPSASDLSAYNTYNGYANQDLSKLLNSYNNQQAQINSNYGQQGNELQSAYNQAQATDQNQVTQQNQALLDQENNIRQGTHQAYQNAMNILGALGAGGSSAALNWAPQAASDFQNIQVGQANKNTAANLASLAGNWDTYQQGFDQQKQKLADAQKQDLANAQSTYGNTKDALSRIISGIQAQNMTPSDIATSLSSVEPSISNTQFVQPSYTGVAPTLATPQLSNYLAPTLQANLSTTTPDNNNTAATPAAIYLASLQNQKKQQATA